MYKVETEIQRFNTDINPYGHLDVEKAVELFTRVNLSGTDLSEQSKQFCEDIGGNMDDLDICYIALDHILQNARNKIDQVLNLDIQNDLDFSVYANCMCSSIEHSDKDLTALKTALSKATIPQIEDLKDDLCVIEFLDQVELKI